MSLAVWDVPSPVVIGRRATLKAGVSCSCGCALAGTTIQIRDHAGASLAAGCVGADPWPATTALHWVALDVNPPDVEGPHAWSIHATTSDVLHPPVESVVSLVVSGPPERRVRFEVVDQGTGSPVGGVELRVGAFRATTNAMGRAQVDVPRGTYDLHAWKLGYELLSRTASIAADTTLRLAMPVTLLPERPYWM